MSNTSVTKYIEHPLVRAYLRDLDVALRGVSAGEAGLIRESVREHFVTEFALADQSAPTETVVKEALAKLGPVESIMDGLVGEEAAGQAHAAAETRRRTIATVVATVLSAVLVPFAVGVSAVLSAVALAVAIKWVSPRQRTILIVVNVTVLVVALVYLIVALTTASALFGPVEGGS